jgi:hypothetical protein
MAPALIRTDTTRPTGRVSTGLDENDHRLYSWNIVHADDERDLPEPCGVSGDRQLAIAAMAAALRDAAPGMRAVLYAVRVSPMKTAMYDYGAMIAMAEHDDGSGAIIWHRS